MKPAFDIRAVAWDVDGTLVDSEPLHAAALMTVCIEHGVGLDTGGAGDFTGVSLIGVWQAIGYRFGVSMGQGDAARARRFYAAVTAAYVALSSRLQPMPGAREAVAWLAGRGLRQCAVSNSHAAIVAANLGVLGAGGEIGFTLALENLRAPKPAPDPYRQACERLGLPPAQVLAVEDSETGLRSAVSAGLSAVLLTPSAESPEPMPSWQRMATHRLASLEALPAWLDGKLFDFHPPSGARS